MRSVRPRCNKRELGEIAVSDEPCAVRRSLSRNSLAYRPTDGAGVATLDEAPDKPPHNRLISGVTDELLWTLCQMLPAMNLRARTHQPVRFSVYVLLLSTSNSRIPMKRSMLLAVFSHHSNACGGTRSGNGPDHVAPSEACAKKYCGEFRSVENGLSIR